MNNQELWQSVLSQIQFTVSKANFATWFRNTKIDSIKEGIVVVSTPNSFSKEWLKTKYKQIILKILRSLEKGVKDIDFIVAQHNNSSLTSNIKQKRTQKRDKILNSPQLQFQEFSVDQETNLNPRYNFDNFIVGSFNEMAHAASLAVSENPGAVYNPLFIYGGVGLGKTHLLQATGNKILLDKKNVAIRYTTSESFISEIIDSIRNHSISSLKKKMHKIDVLIMDDVQFFAGKEKTQEEFFHIFNHLYQHQRQIILSSDRPPSAIPTLTERLRSRFGGGMTIDIGTPDLETRIVILKSKLEEKNINLNQEALNYIASNIQKNIREIEGFVNRLVIFQNLNQKTPDINIVKELLKSQLNPLKKSVNFKKIIKSVASFYDLDEKELLEATRRKEIVKPRQIAMYLLREELKESYSLIGRRFKGKDHTTAIYACEKIAKQLELDDSLLTEINMIKQRVYSDL